MEPDHDSWRGWQFVGRHLVTPDRDRITAEVLAHLVHMHRIRLHFESVGLQAQATRAREKRHQEAQQAVKVVVVDLGAWKASHGLGAA